MRIVSIVAHGRFYAPAPQKPTVTFFMHLCELGELEYEAREWMNAAYWYRHALSHAPACPDAQAAEVSTKFVSHAEQEKEPRLIATKLRAGCYVLKGALL